MIVKSNSRILASAARTATPTIPNLEFANRDLTDIQIIIDVTVDPASAIITPQVQGQDPTSGKWFDLIASVAAISAVGTTVLSFGENTPFLANLSNTGFIPENIRLVLTHTDADSITYSVGINFRQDR